MRRHEMNVLRQMRRHIAHHRAFDRADIGHGRAGRQMRADLLGDRAAGADRNADDDEVGAFDARRPPSRPPDRRGPVRRRACASPPSARWRRSSRPRLARAPRARSTSRSGRRRSAPAGCRAASACSRCSPQKLVQRRDHQPVGFLGADGHAQRIRQAVAGDAAQDEAALRSGTRRHRRRSCPWPREMDQHEIRHARRHLSPSLPISSLSQASHFLLCATDASDMRGSPRSRQCRPSSPAC